MKIAVFSDSHGRPERMLRAIEYHSPDMIIHLGDGGSDIAKIKKQFPQIPLKAVQGNCDLSSVLPETELFSVSDVKIFITHGHLFGVKRNTISFIDRAAQIGADVAMYGHTHIADYLKIGNLHVLNPGSCGSSPSASFAEVVITDNKIVFCRIIKL